jgi:flavin-binding protein dodecin
MSVAKIIEISAESTQGFEDAIRDGLRRANRTVSGIKRAWVQDQLVEVEDGEVTRFRVHLKVTFVLEE